MPSKFDHSDLRFVQNAMTDAALELNAMSEIDVKVVLQK